MVNLSSSQIREWCQNSCFPCRVCCLLALLNSLDMLPTKRHKLESFLINCTGEDKNSLLFPILQKTGM